jgi:hypothetical protein
MPDSPAGDPGRERTVPPTWPTTCGHAATYANRRSPTPRSPARPAGSASKSDAEPSAVRSHFIARPSYPGRDGRRPRITPTWRCRLPRFTQVRRTSLQDEEVVPHTCQIEGPAVQPSGHHRSRGVCDVRPSLASSVRRSLIDPLELVVEVRPIGQFGAEGEGGVDCPGEAEWPYRQVARAPTLESWRALD